MNSLKGIFFLREEGFQVQTALSLFTVNAFCQLPSVDMSMPNSTVTHAQMCPCDTAEYQHELLCTNSQTNYNNGLHDTWAGCNAAYESIVKCSHRNFSYFTLQYGEASPPPALQLSDKRVHRDKSFPFTHLKTSLSYLVSP